MRRIGIAIAAILLSASIVFYIADWNRTDAHTSIYLAQATAVLCLSLVIIERIQRRPK